MNGFVKANTFDAGVNGTRTENGAISYANFGTELMNQFGKAGAYRGRDIQAVWDEQARLWGENPELALKFPFYLRLITRQTTVNGDKTEKVQKGQGARDEAFKRLLWIAKYHPTEFYRNLWLLPVVGSWKDLWVLMAFDGAGEYLNWDKFFAIIAEGINDSSTRELVKKYMPRIRSNSKCKTPWAVRTNVLAKAFAKTVGWSFEEYRKYKATGIAHKFQTIICKGLYDKINWKEIPGKALLNLVSGGFLNRHSLEEAYLNWLDSQPVAKFNGYPFELGRKVNAAGWNGPSLAQKVTIDKQFKNLIETAKKDGTPIKGNVLCALDTSGSMSSPLMDKSGTAPIDVCISLGIYFSELNQGAFHNVVAMFDDVSTFKTLKGDSFCDKWSDIMHATTAWGSTNFQSVIDLIVDTRRKHPEIALEDYPETLLVVSDMQFNPTNDWARRGDTLAEQSNFETAKRKLSEVFPKEFVDKFRIIWWYCASRETNDFPSTMDDAGTYMISGFDGATVSFLLGGEIKKDENGNAIMPTMEDIINEALTQEVLCLVS